jgi:ABC-type Na+ efflux pump permease subunit
MVGATICFFLPAKSLFFLGASSLNKLPIGYFVAFIPFMFSSLLSMEEKEHLGKGLNPIPFG